MAPCTHAAVSLAVFVAVAPFALGLKAREDPFAAPVAAPVAEPLGEPSAKPEKDGYRWTRDDRISAGLPRTDMAQFMKESIISSCSDWLAYFWPKVSFWSQEVYRRAMAVNTSDPDAMEHLRKFAHKASMYTCVKELDPRKGSLFAKPVSALYKKVATASSTDLGMPQVPNYVPNFKVQGDSCVWWSEVQWCEMGYWAMTLRGDKRWTDGVCWHEVPFPDNFYTLATSKDLRTHPEYLQCQDRELDDDALSGICPFNDLLPMDYHGMLFTGTGVPKEHRKQVVQECRNKLHSNGSPMPRLKQDQVWDLSVEGLKTNVWPGPYPVPKSTFPKPALNFPKPPKAPKAPKNPFQVPPFKLPKNPFLR